MATYLFAFNPVYWSWPELADDIRSLKRRGHVDITWGSGRVRAIEPGSRAFMIRVGTAPKGLFGAGVTMTAPTPRPHWDAAKAAAGVVVQHLTLRLEALYPLPIVGFDDLERPPFSRFRWGIRSSGTRLPSSLADALEPLWEARVAAAMDAAADAATKRKPVGAVATAKRKPVAATPKHGPKAGPDGAKPVIRKRTRRVSSGR